MDIYPMCKPQQVQLDCRKEDCKYHVEAKCINISPAISLFEDKFVCWSEDLKKHGSKK